LPDEVTDACEKLVTIPIKSGGAAESLNVGAAAAIALHTMASGEINA
jgi:tRNA G18 (ribose-2'-O)-methylase SpoU